tara:strand:- start:1430 stop:2386 length:957 start_codon:yes stop_codon:yes gene_type:complete
MKILITGSAGFIGYHLSLKLLKNKNYKIIGLDSLNNYYDKKVKKKRLKILTKNKNFFFYKINLLQKKALYNLFKKNKFDVVFHIAGQPGVLYSIKNPNSYLLNNIKATKVLSKIAKDFLIKKFVFASSSSIYGDQKKFPISESFKPNPKNPYAKTKLESEKIVLKTFNRTRTKFIIFRFFTVYGPFGRPDMFIHKFLNSIKKNKKINIYNNGMNYRDFTYVNDVTKILDKYIKKKISHKILNICRSKPILTNDLIKLLIKNYPYKKKPNIKKIEFVKGEVLKTHGSNKNLQRIFGKIIFTDIKKGIKDTVKSFKIYNA